VKEEEEVYTGFGATDDDEETAGFDDMMNEFGGEMTAEEQAFMALETLKVSGTHPSTCPPVHLSTRPPPTAHPFVECEPTRVLNAPVCSR
jgi:hypothetical protein